MRVTVLVLVLLGQAVVRPAAQVPVTGPWTAPLDRAMRDYWSAGDAGAQRVAAARIVAAGAPFEAVRARFVAGRPYRAARSGAVSIETRVGDLVLDNLVEVPTAYDPARRWPVRVSLHGGVGRRPPGPGIKGRPLTNRTPLDGEIVIHPRAWAQVEWWTPGQADNIARLLERVRHDYNTDESRTYLSGISDGGTGTYYFAMRWATPWSACIPLNGHPMVLTNPAVGEDEQFYAGNLANCPLHVVNGGRDPLYPAASVVPLIEMLRAGRVPVSFQVYPTAGHNVDWWPQERARVETFLAAHPRAAHPASLSWETDRTDRFNRFRWIVIDRLGPRSSDLPLDDVNTFYQRTRTGELLYRRGRPSGRVDATRSGNDIELRTRGVRRLTLLLGPDALDLSRPVRVIVNGRLVHDAVVRPSVATLLEWAVRDDDRTMLYAAALPVEVP